MPAGIAIKSATNALDGAHGNVALTGTPSGSVSFVASRYPTLSTASAVTSTLADGVYSVELPAPVLWYIWASDTSGTTAQPGAVWIGASNDPILNQAGYFLQELLESNRAGINAAIQTLFPGSTLKSIVYGTATVLRDFPCILITKPQVSWEWFAMPFTRAYTYQFEIFCMWTHQDVAPITRLTAQFTSRVMDIINLPKNTSITLPDGTPLTLCQATQGEIEDVQLDDNKFGALGSLIWSGQACITDMVGGYD